MPGPIFLRGDRIDLRVVEDEAPDRSALAFARNDPELRRSLGFDTPWSRDRVEAFRSETDTDDSSVNLLVCQDGRAADERVGGTDAGGGEIAVLGAVNLFEVDRVEGTLSYWLHEEHRGRGYATEAVELLVDHAFSELGLHRVAAQVFAENDASWRLLERLGFVHEGTDRECRVASGEYGDVERYGLLENEWRGDRS